MGVFMLFFQLNLGDRLLYNVLNKKVLYWTVLIIIIYLILCKFVENNLFDIRFLVSGDDFAPLNQKLQDINIKSLIESNFNFGHKALKSKLLSFSDQLF